MHLDLRYMPCWQDGFTRHGIHVKSDHMTYAIIIWSCAISRHSKSLCDFSFICPVTSLVIGTTLWSVKLFHLLWASGWRTLLRLTPGSVWRQGTLFAQNTKSTWMSGIRMKKTLTFHQYWIDALVGFRFVWFLSVMSSDARKGQQASWQHFEYVFVTWRVVSTSLWLLDCNLHCWTMFINDWFVYLVSSLG